MSDLASPPPLASRPLVFALPPSLGTEQAADRGARLARFLSDSMGKRVEVSVAQSYEGLAKDLLAGRTDVAWAPPFVCARVEAMGVRILVRGVRKGASTYRAALLCRKGRGLTLDKLSGLTARWVDRDSVGGYLLATAFLRARGLEPSKLFFSQEFAGSYRAALEGVLEGKADVTSVFAPPAGQGPDQTRVDDVLPGRSGETEVIAFTDEAPNDGLAVSMSMAPALAGALEQSLLSLHETSEGAALLKDIFNNERFESAPRLGYRALYRVALASL